MLGSAVEEISHVVFLWVWYGCWVYELRPLLTLRKVTGTHQLQWVISSKLLEPDGAV